MYFAELLSKSFVIKVLSLKLRTTLLCFIKLSKLQIHCILFSIEKSNFDSGLFINTLS